MQLYNARIYSSTTANHNGLATCGFVYMHGKLDDLFGLDLCLIDEDKKDLLEKEGVYPVNVVVNSNNEIPSLLFLWKSGRGVTGLVVDVTDTDALFYATSLYNDKKADF